MAEQRVLSADRSYRELDECFLQDSVTHVFLVCGHSAGNLDISGYFDGLENRLGIRVTRFSGFTPNPRYEEVERGVKCFRESGCNGIMAVGGGSAIDVAKCIKLYAHMSPSENYLKQAIIPNSIPFYAAPTTAGTGSEATRFAVIYYDGEKQSVTDESCIPSVILLRGQFLEGLPLYQKKATLLDALCHGIESFWSVNSTEESRLLSEKAIRSILSNWKSYFENRPEARNAMLWASYWAGQAINITQTTAGHAMCYKLTSLYGISHGHAAALCVKALWPYMLEHLKQCADPRGISYLADTFLRLSGIFGVSSASEGAAEFGRLIMILNMETPHPRAEKEYDLLKISVNPVRLKNNPIYLKADDIDKLYHQILRKDEKSED